MSDINPADQQVFDSMADTANLLFGAQQNALDVPIEDHHISFSGDRAEATGTARHIAEEIEDEGYIVSVEYDGEREPVVNDERHGFLLTIEQA